MLFKAPYDLSYTYLGLISYLQPCSPCCGQKGFFWSHTKRLPVPMSSNLLFPPTELCFLQNLYMILLLLFWWHLKCNFLKETISYQCKNPLPHSITFYTIILLISSIVYYSLSNWLISLHVYLLSLPWNVIFSWTRPYSHYCIFDAEERFVKKYVWQILNEWINWWIY